MSVLYAVEKALPQNIKVERFDRRDLTNALLYRGWKDNGDHSNQFCVELQFKNERTAKAWLKRHRIDYEQVEDHQELPWIED